MWNTKAKKWVVGRRYFPKYNEPPATKNIVWMHCASLGEFEQGRPLIEKLKQISPNTKIVITFFSPSGYEIMKQYAGADYIFYLPIDSAKNAKKFIDVVQPTLVLWVKYEYWLHYLKELKNRNIPVLLVSGIFRKTQPFFKWYGNIWKEMLHCFTHFFVQNETSKELLASVSITQNVSISDDTRFDRVIGIAENFEAIEAIEKFIGNDKVIVAGSTWEEDDDELVHYAKTHPEIKFIIAPHEIDEENLADIQKKLYGAVLYSSLADGSWAMNQKASASNGIKNVLIIDNIGMLSKLYRYATICYVGGGFGKDGVHNVLEAAVYGKVVIFGPVYDKYLEAVELIACGGAYSITCAIELEQVINQLLADEMLLKKNGEASKKYVSSKAGATKKIIGYIQEKRLLIS